MTTLPLHTVNPVSRELAGEQVSDGVEYGLRLAIASIWAILSNCWV